VSDVLFERYKDALRRGHVATERGRPDEALAAYREATDLAPDRAVPYARLGGVLAGLGRSNEALAAYDQALARAPDEEAALRGRANLLIVASRRLEAAETLDRLSALRDRQGRLADACDAAREALELAESRDRRRDVETYAKRLRSEGRDAASTAALGRALEILGAPSSTPPVLRSSTPAESPSDETIFGVMPERQDHDASPTYPAEPIRPDLMAVAETAMDGDDIEAVRAAILAASAAQRTAGMLEAALDTCYLALAVLPADPDIHLAFAELYLDRGWRALGADKIRLLARLADLTGDQATHDRLAALVRSRLADEPDLAARYA
jgi:tetratricopeptide (TPR) repeat protein